MSQVENWLELVHDRRKLIEISWQSRKTQVEQCLALALLTKELLEVEQVLGSRRQSLAENDQLGDCTARSKLFLEELSRNLVEAKVK